MTEILRYAAFTTTPDGGNPAGIVLDASRLTDAEMQAIAADVGYSETAFVVGTSAGAPGHYRVRYFSPLAEVPFCGHATIATAVALAERGRGGALVFDTAAGEITIETSEDADGIVARLRSVPTHSTPASTEQVRRALDALGWSPADLGPLPPHVAFAGNDHLVLQVATRARLADLHYDFDALKNLMTSEGWTTLQLVFMENDHLVHARDPFPVGGVVEDPATGAAAAALGGYLRAIGHVTQPVTIVVRQGTDMGRPSELRIDVAPDDPRVTVSGHAVAMH
ncbi:PhzF family phenazine biosynthesis isomerase [Sanguibacter sp. 25GB23B1]|uniref:PhzF family phenazine biosynthesis protein n=1 Tax=unclassified Sanguibacter TaxID=2645534 RepID=UPI0032AEB34E